MIKNVKIVALVSMLVLLSGCGAVEMDGATVVTGMPLHNISVEPDVVVATMPMGINMETDNSGELQGAGNEIGDTNEGVTDGDTDGVDTVDNGIVPNPKAGVKKLYKVKEQEKGVWAEQNMAMFRAELAKGTTLQLSSDSIRDIVGAVATDGAELSDDVQGVRYTLRLKDAKADNQMDYKLITYGNQYLMDVDTIRGFELSKYTAVYDTELNRALVVNKDEHSYIAYVKGAEEKEQNYDTITFYTQNTIKKLEGQLETFVEDGIGSDGDTNYIYEKYDVVIDKVKCDCTFYYDEQGIMIGMYLDSTKGGTVDKLPLVDFRVDINSDCVIDNSVIDGCEQKPCETAEDLTAFNDTIYTYDWDKYAEMIENEDKNDNVNILDEIFAGLE